MKYNHLIWLVLVVFNSMIASANHDECIPVPPPPPSNDECSGAIPLTVGTTCSYTQYTNASATASSGIPAPGCASYSGGDVWFSVVVPASGRLIIDTQTGVMTDGGMAIYSGTCGSLSLIECDDDDSNNGLMPSIDKSGLTVGSTIYIRVWEYGNNNNGTFSICVYSATSGTSSATTCATADPFCTGTGLVFPASVDAGTGQSGPDYGCLCTQPNPVWYYLRIANPGSLTINISSTCGDVDYAAWGPFSALTCSSSDLTSTVSSCGGNLSAPAGNMVDCAFSTSATEALSIPSALAGQYYLVMITNYANCTGNINFNQTSGSGSTDCSIIAPPVSNNGPLCVGQTLNLTVSVPMTGATYAWTGPNGFTSSTMNPSITNVTAVNAGVYSLVILVGGVASAPVTTTLVVNAAPSASVGSNSAICAGSTLNLTSSGGTSYAWSGPNSFASTLQNPSITSTTVSTAGVYTVTVTGTGGCTATAQTTVVINGSITVTPTSNAPICQNQTLNLTVPIAGGTYIWSGPNSFSCALQSPSITNATTAASGIYSVTVTSSSGCTGIGTIGVVVNPQPVAAISGDSTICDGGSTVLTATGGNSYVWSNTLTFSSITVSPSVQTAYTVTVTAIGGCTSTSTRNVFVNSNPQIDSIVIRNENCNSGNGKATANISNGLLPYQYIWSNGIGNTPNDSLLSTGIHSVTVSDANGCSSTQAFTIQNIPGPILSIASVVNDHCNQGIGQATVIVNNIPGNYSYSWLTSPPQQGISAVGLMAGTYTAAVTDGVCSNTISVTIGNIEGPTANFEANPATTNTTNSLIHFMNQSVGAQSYLWDFGDGTGSTEENPVHPYLVADTFTVFLQITDAYGCIDTVSKTVIVFDDFNLFIPNAFTPNNDEKNEVFRPYGRGINFARPYQMLIYDRWGKLVFSSIQLEHGWNGKIDGANIKSNGVFTYYISIFDIANAKHVFKGTFTVMGSKTDDDF